MKAIILAAGMGTRIAEHISHTHKCLLPITRTDHKYKYPLLVYTLRKLQKYGIKETYIITGYRHESIEENVLEYNAHCYFNPFYSIVNSIGSLWFVEKHINNSDDIIILNGDTFLEETLYKHILSQEVIQSHPLLLVDSTKTETADVKVKYNNSLLTDYGKDLTESVMGESVDVAIIPRKLAKTFHYQLKTLLDQNHIDYWWESALTEYLHTTPVKVLDVAGHFWQEIDNIEDYEKIKNFYATSKA